MTRRSKAQDVPDFAAESAAMRAGSRFVAGIDEAGRGPLAGPVSAAAVILDPRALPEGVNDSKKLGAAAREALFDRIMTQALAVSFAFAPAGDIDRLNIRQATHLAMRRALAGLSLRADFALVDGNDLPANLGCPGRTIVGGDAKSLSIASASIVAKVMRDRAMDQVDRACPAWGFAQHKGYGTRRHLDAIAQHGASPFHRMSFAPLRNDDRSEFLS